MPTKLPKTPFCTRLSGSARETKLRLRSIFQWEKRRPPVWLFALIVVAIIGCGGLFACRDNSDMPEILLEDGTRVYAPMPVLDNPTADIFYQKPGEEKHILMQLPYSAHELDWSTVELREFYDVSGKSGVVVSFQLGSSYRTEEYYLFDDKGAYPLTAEKSGEANEVLLLQTSGGREITVELDLEATPKYETYYAVTQIRVVENERVLQTIDPTELKDTHNIEGLYLLRGYDVGEPDVRDFNFDGAEDLALLAESTIPQNPSYLFFLWNKEKRGLEASFVMTALPELDEQQKQITEKMTNGRCRYYDWQAGWLRENPAPRQTMDLLEQIGEPFEQFVHMEYQTVPIPNAAGLCMGEEQSDVGYFFVGTQGLPGLAEMTEEYTRRLRCAGIVSTVGELFPQITDGMPVNWFCDALAITDYTYGFEDLPDQGWLNFSWNGYAVWIDTDNPVTEAYDPNSVIIAPDDMILISDVDLEKKNLETQEEFWRGEPVVEPQVLNGISPITQASSLSDLSSTRRNWLADLPVAELPKEAVRLNELFSSDLWRDMLIPLAYDEEADVTIYGVVDLTERPTDDRVLLDLWEMEPYGIVIRKGNRAVYHSLYWGLHLWCAGNPELYMGDFDHDGETEAALQLWTGRGTGCSVFKLYIFELDDLTCSVPDYSTLNISVEYDETSGMTTLISGACELTVEVPEQYRIFDSVSCGNVVSFSCEDGQLYMEAELDFYKTFAYLAAVKVPIIYEDGTYRLGEVVSLTETNY